MKTYIKDTATVKEMKAVERLINRLYNQYNSVKVTPLGLTRTLIVCTGKIQ